MVPTKNWVQSRFASYAAAAALAALLGGVAAPAHAYMLYVEQSGGTNSNNGNPNLITDPANFALGEQSGGVTLTNPLLLIVGVYDGGTSATAPTVTFDGSDASLAAIGTYGLTGNGVEFSAASGTTATAYSVLGLGGAATATGTDPELFSVWQTDSGEIADTNFTDAANFELFAYSLNTSLDSGSAISLGISGAPDGSMLIGYTCVATASPCSKPIAQTLSNDAGMLAAPEPASIVLLGSGIVGLLGLRRRRRSA